MSEPLTVVVSFCLVASPLIVGNRPFLNMALSISSWPPLLTTEGISANSGTSSSNHNGNRSTSTFRHLFVHPHPSIYVVILVMTI
jgi:hypothetical protein